MNPRTLRKLDKINKRLIEYGQQTRVLSLTATLLILNSGITLSGNEASKFIKRVMNEKIIDWVKNIDKLLSGEVDEKDIKKISFSVGGKACQEKHGEKIKLNLNTGEPWNRDKKGCQVGWSKGLTKTTDERVAKFAKFGEKNPMFGKSCSTESKNKKSALMKGKILNGSFTPNSNNRNTHWESSYAGKKYRSSWEAWYQSLNPLAEYETFRIEYVINDNTKVYIVDFVDHLNKLLIEVKPVELCFGEIFKSKMSALAKWAADNEYEIVLATKDWLVDQAPDINYALFDENTAQKIRKAYETSKKNRNTKT